MNPLRKIFGIVWILLAPGVMIFVIYNAVDVIRKANKVVVAATSEAAKAASEAARTNTILQWSIIIIILLPIAFALIIFGKYALQGEYDR
jgi:hypothetical protein